ncbi:MAG: hypothetical protein V3V67_08405 [Myxococcota bacterium]
MNVLKWLGATLLGVAVLIGALFLIAPFRDGPIGPIPGGPLESGELVSQPVTDWSFATSVETIEMQLVVDGNRSRTTWLFVHEGSAFIPVTLGFPPGKSWHTLAVEDGRALVRIYERRYPVTLTKVDDPELLDALAAANAAKYPPAPGSDTGSWYFKLEHREA